MPQIAKDRRVDSVCSFSLLSAQEALISHCTLLVIFSFLVTIGNETKLVPRHPQHFNALGVFAAPSFYRTGMDFVPNLKGGIEERQ